MLCACLAQMLGCAALPLLMHCTVPNQVLRYDVMLQNCDSKRQDTMSRPAEHREFALYIEHHARH